MLLDDGTQHRCKDENSFNCQHLVAPKCYVMIVDVSEIWLTYMFNVSMKSYANAKWKFLHIFWGKISYINIWRMWRQTSEIETSNLSHHVKRITPPNPGAPKGIVLQTNDSAQQPGAGLSDPTWSLHGGRLKKGFHPRYFKGACHDDPPPPQSFECSIGPLLRLAWQLRMDSYK